MYFHSNFILSHKYLTDIMVESMILVGVILNSFIYNSPVVAALIDS